MARVEGASWNDIDTATDAIFGKRAEVAPSAAPSPLDAFDLDGNLDLIARLQKAAAESDQGVVDEEPEPPKKPEPKKENGGEEEPDKDDQEKTAQVAAAAVMRQTLVDVCSVLAGGEASMDKIAATIGIGILEGHSGSEIEDFVSGMEKSAFELPWRDLPSAGAATRLRQTVYRTPDERNLQAEARLGRSQAAAAAGLDKQLLQDETLYANRAAATAKADAMDRLSKIRMHMQTGLSRPEAEKLLNDQAQQAERAALARARKSAGLDTNKIRLGFGNAGLDVNKRLFTKTAPMVLAPLAAGYLLGGGLRRHEDERPRGITIS